jgi:hypothetical protein
MKKLIFILSMFLVGCNSCTVQNNKPIIVTNIEKSDITYCNYYGYASNIWSNKYEFKFRDTCGKFQIGDTLNIVVQ